MREMLIAALAASEAFLRVCDEFQAMCPRCEGLLTDDRSAAHALFLY